MRGKRILFGMISGFASLFSVTTFSAVQMSVPNGWYLEANGGSSHLSNFSLPGSTSSSGIGGNANLGYKFMPYVAAEIGYSRFANTAVHNSLGSKVATGKHYSYDIAIRGIIPIADSGFEAFAKVGGGRINTNISINNSTSAAQLGIGSGSHSSTGLYLGLGAQYYVLPEFAIVAQWQRIRGSSSSGTEDLYSLGLSFIFV